MLKDRPGLFVSTVHHTTHMVAKLTELTEVPEIAVCTG